MTSAGPETTARQTTRASHEVGYAKPPKQYRFKSGKSGNPKGRPKGSKNRKRVSTWTIADLIIKAGQKPVTINTPEGPVDSTMIEANLTSLAVKGAKGETRAQKLFIELHERAERERRQQEASEPQQIIIQRFSGDANEPKEE